MKFLLFSLCILQVLYSASAASKGVPRTVNKTIVSNDGFVGCPYNNDFYYIGGINSPLYPQNYPPNDKCYYYITAERGSVVGITFDFFDLETCCDYVTIYDGPSDRSPILARFGGPSMTARKPILNQTYVASTRNALVTFVSDDEIEQKGFRMTYTSVKGVKPCTRDVLLVVNGMSSVGSQEHFMSQINFLANELTPTWNVGMDTMRVAVSLQIADSYAVEYDPATDNNDLTKTLLDLAYDVPDVMQNNETSIASLFAYAYNVYQQDRIPRDGVELATYIFIGSNAVNSQDYYRAQEYAHLIRTVADTRVIIVGMQSHNNLNVNQINTLSETPQFSYFSDYRNMSALVPQLNAGMCVGRPFGNCGP